MPGKKSSKQVDERVKAMQARLAADRAKRKAETGKATINPRQRLKDAAIAEAEGRGYEGDPWEKEVEESDKHWIYFQTYRDMGRGKRSVRETAKVHNLTLPTMLKVCTANDWVVRAAAYDAEIDKAKRQADLDAITKMRERHINISMLRQSLGVREVQKIDARSKANQGPVMPLMEANKLVEDGIRLERLNRGEPESIHEERHELTVGEKRSKLRALIESPDVEEHIEAMADALLDKVKVPPARSS